jgi:hypothetical protein
MILFLGIPAMRLLTLTLTFCGTEGMLQQSSSKHQSAAFLHQLHLDDHHDLGRVAFPERRKLFREMLATVFLTTGVLELPPAHATTMDPKTGIRLPDPGEIEAAVPRNWDDVDNPFSDSDDAKIMFRRLDSTPDSKFYQDPRFVEHVDDNAVQLMTNYISKVVIQPGDAAVLDLCSSWVSHIDENVAKKVPRIAGLGMNDKELQSNSLLTEHVVQDLNQNPILSKYDNDSFDVVLCQLSIDYLTRPLEVLKEVSRILKPGGRVHILFSNRLFFSKAVSGWTGSDDIDHAYTVACYLHFSGGNFKDIQAKDLSTRKGQRIVGDPMYVVMAVK